MEDEKPKARKKSVRPKRLPVKPVVPALPPEPKTLPVDPSLKLYRRIAVSFVLLTCVLLFGVVYLSFASATIQVVAEPQTITVSKKIPISGKVLSTIFEQAKTFILEGDGETVQAKAGGLVTIYNTHSADQPLVATTRLLSPEGVLFRLDDTVNVPAGGSVVVSAHADVVGQSGEIAPTRFTIPGLNESLQKKIYAENSEVFTGGEVIVQVLTQEQLDTFALQLQEQIAEAAEEQLMVQAGEYSGQVFTTEVLERKSDTEPGKESGQVTLSLRVQVNGVFFDKEAMWEQMQDELLAAIPEDFELQATSIDQMMLSIEQMDVDAGVATLLAKVDGSALLSPQSALLEKGQFAGKSAASVKEQLEAYDLIASVDVRLTPFWLKRLPSLPDHIQVEVE